MASDQQHQDDVDEDVYVPTGARRSTYTPPADGVIRLGDEQIVLDDDLAEALERQLQDTGAIRLPGRIDSLRPQTRTMPEASPVVAQQDDADDDGDDEQSPPAGARGSKWPEWARADAEDDERESPYEPLPSHLSPAATVDPVLFPPASELLSRLGDLGATLPREPGPLRGSGSDVFAGQPLDEMTSVAPLALAEESTVPDAAAPSAGQPPTIREVDAEQHEPLLGPDADDVATDDDQDSAPEKAPELIEVDATAGAEASAAVQAESEVSTAPPPVPEPEPLRFGEDGLPVPPARRSLSDAELVAQLAAEGDDHASFERLEEQMALRARELEQFGRWEHAMQDIGSPEALERVERMRPLFTGSIPVVGAADDSDAEPIEGSPVAPLPVADAGAATEQTTDEGVDAESAPTGAVVLPALDELFAPGSGPARSQGRHRRYEPAAPKEDRAVPAAATPTEAFAQLTGAIDIVPQKANEGGPDRAAEEPDAPLEQDAAEQDPPAEQEDSPEEPVHLPATEAIDMSEVRRREAGEAARRLEAEYDAAATGQLWPLEPLPAEAPEPSGPPVEALATVDDERHATLRFDADEPHPATATVPVVVPVYDLEIEDEVDATDRAFAPESVAVDPEGVAVVTNPPTAPVDPVSTPRTSEEYVLADTEPARRPLFDLEAASLEPTPLDHRVGRAARLFWIWFAANGSLLSVVLGAGLVGLGLDGLQALTAIAIGLVASAVPLALGTLAGKWSGQPTLVVSRATFGLLGNALPATLAVVTRVVWGGLLLALTALAVTGLLGPAGLGGAGVRYASLAAALAIAAVVAVFGYTLIVAVQTVVAVLTAVLAVAFVALTLPRADLAAVAAGGEASWWLVPSGAALVFGLVGVVWANSTGDVARYQQPSGSGAASMSSATFGAALPVLLLAGWGVVLAASDPGLAAALASDPVAALSSLVPAPLAAALLAGTALSLVGGAVLTLYSGAFALAALGLRARRWQAVVFAAVLAGLVAALLVGGSLAVLPDLAVTLAVPTAVWAGLFGAEMLLRRSRFESPALLRRGGVYADWVPSNLVALVLLSVLGFAFTTADAPGFGWLGFGWTLLGLPATDPLAQSDLGVFAAFVLALLVPVLFSRGGIRRQERRRH